MQKSLLIIFSCRRGPDFPIQRSLSSSWARIQRSLLTVTGWFAQVPVVYNLTWGGFVGKPVWKRALPGSAQSLALPMAPESKNQGIALSAYPCWSRPPVQSPRHPNAKDSKLKCSPFPLLASLTEIYTKNWFHELCVWFAPSHPHHQQILLTQWNHIR